MGTNAGCLSNGKRYVAKGLELPEAERVAEWMGARLAAAFGLPIPEHGALYVDQALLRYNTEARQALGAGECFALEYVANAADMMFSQISRVPTTLQKALFVFDYWIGNGDRQLTALGGRPNLLVGGLDNKVWLIDHNQAFQWPLDAAQFAATHVFGLANRSWRLDMVDRVEYTQRMQDTAARFRSLCMDIPEQWYESMGEAGLDALLDVMESNLLRCQLDDFWSVLE